MKLPSFRRLFAQDYGQEFKDLVDKLAGSLNYGIEVLYNTLNNNVTLSDNIACTVAEFVAEVNSSGNPKSSISFKLRNNQRVEGLIVLSCINLTNAAIYPPAAVFVNFTNNSDTIIINNIKGLDANIQYRIKVVAFN